MILGTSCKNAQGYSQGIIILFQIEDVYGISDGDIPLRALDSTQNLRNFDVHKRGLLVFEDFHYFFLFHVPGVGKQFLIVSHVLELQGINV